MSGSPVGLQIESGVAVATLSEPARMNRFTTVMRNSLVEVLETVSVHPDVRAFVLTAAGDHFCVGGDVTEFGNAPTVYEARRIRWLVDPWLRLWNLRVPTVAALRGYTLGSGLEMAMFCDLRIADETLTMGLPELSIGMLPAAGGTQTLGRLANPAGALYAACLDRTIDAREALDRRLIHEVSEALDRRVEEIAGMLSELSPEAVRAARQAARMAVETPLPLGLTAEKRLARRTQLTTDK